MGTNRQLDHLHKYINNIHSNIKFTLETESDQSINFLDLTITNINHNHNFKIFRKATQTDHTIHHSSQHPYQHKIAAYHHMLNRLNNIPMFEADYVDELNLIKYIAYTNGYQEKIIDRINTKIVNKTQLHNLTTLHNNEKDEKRYISLQYNNFSSNFMKKIFHRFGYTIAFKTSNNTQHKLKVKTNIRRHDCGIYKLICNDCDKYYLGQTSRKFDVRFKEHTDEVKHKKSLFKSNYAQHLVEEKHTYTDIDNNLIVLHRIEKGNMMNIMEELEIYRQRNNPSLLNEKINTKTNKLFDLIIACSFQN